MNELEIFTCPQNSPEWYQARLGLVTMSELKSVMAKGQGITRRKYLLTVVGELLAGQPFERYTNADMERGHILEQEARDAYTLQTDIEVEQIGFMRRGRVGYSPDGLAGASGLLEIKTKMYHLHLECILSNAVPSEHMLQCQGGLWVSGREWLDFVSYAPGLALFVKRVYRDEKKIAEIKIEVEDFLHEVDITIGKINLYRRG